MMKLAAPMGLKHRVSSDGVWPLRRADGRTWAEAKKPKQMALPLYSKDQPEGGAA